MKKILVVLMLVLSHGVIAQSDPNMGIIPAPAYVKQMKGEFKMTSETIILTDSPDHKAVRYFADYLRTIGFTTGITDMTMLGDRQGSLKNAIAFVVNFKGDLPPEGYELNITEDRVT